MMVSGGDLVSQGDTRSDFEPPVMTLEQLIVRRIGPAG
jgi:hypothetical protein